MKASELRLGNLVSNMNPRHNDSILTIDSIGNNHEVNVFYRKYLLSELEPIPLTEEWLLKFGFERNGKKLTFWKIDLVEDEEGIFSFDEARIYIDIKHVHQLQNLYFSLTGEELTLNQES